MKAAYYTLGCKVNQYDTQLMRDRLEQAGYETVPFQEQADIYIINTCTVTQISDKKSRQMVSRAKRNNPNSILIVCGCYAQIAPNAAAALEGVDIVLGTSNRKDILKYIETYLRDRKQIVEADNCGQLEREEISSFGEKNRAVLKIEDGCENFCSYCLIPFAEEESVPSHFRLSKKKPVRWPPPAITRSYSPAFILPPTERKMAHRVWKKPSAPLPPYPESNGFASVPWSRGSSHLHFWRRSDPSTLFATIFIFPCKAVATRP